MFRTQPGPGPPRTLGERVGRLADELQRLAVSLKGEVARVVGEAVAGAVRDALRLLLGAAQEECRQRPLTQPQSPEDWYDDPWEEADPPEPEPAVQPPPERRSERWNHAWRVAAQVALWWLRLRPGTRPWLTTTLVALAAGGAALALGPGAGIAWSSAGLFLSAGAAGSLGDWLTSMTP